MKRIDVLENNNNKVKTRATFIYNLLKQGKVRTNGN